MWETLLSGRRSIVWGFNSSLGSHTPEVMLQPSYSTVSAPEANWSSHKQQGRELVTDREWL
jgi:hypothetical protein